MATGHFDYINSRHIPYPNREYVESFENLAGGMNTMIRPVQLGGNESPFMKNLSWRNGALGCRRGQVSLFSNNSAGDPRPVSSASFLFHGWWIVQNPEGFSYYKLRKTGESEAEKNVGTVVIGGFLLPVPSEQAGTFLLYRDKVYFKNKGNYCRIEWSSVNDTFSVTTIASLISLVAGSSSAYVPTIQQNTDPTTGAGEPFQQQNRLSYQMKVTFNGNGTSTVYHLPITFDTPVVGLLPAPTAKIDGVDVALASYSAQNGTVTFSTAPAVGQDNVEVTFSKRNTDAFASILNASAAIVYGGSQDLCIVVGGTEAQPNAYFWSGHDGNTMNPTYFPMNQYNLAGEVDAPITAFGRQQNMLVIFQPNAVGRAVLSTTKIGGTSEVVGLETITMDYTRINAEIGCDLPGSLQLVENNLVWCNRKYGVCRLKDSSAAYENNIVVISRKINNKGSNDFDGLLDEFKPGADGIVAPVDYSARSVDTGTRYILRTSNGHAYEWNYEISEWGNPSWFYHTDIGGVGFLALENDTLFEIEGSEGNVAEFQDGVFYDQWYVWVPGEVDPTFMERELRQFPIDKVFWFPPRFLGGYDRLKNIMSAIFDTKSETDQNTTITYICDYRHRTDPTNIKVTAPTNAPMGQPYATISRRKPGYHNIRHLQIGLSNNEVGKDLNILSAYIYYTYRGRQR